MGVSKKHGVYIVAVAECPTKTNSSELSIPK